MTRAEVVQLYAELVKLHPILKRWTLKIASDKLEKFAYAVTIISEKTIRVEPSYLSRTPPHIMRTHLLHELGHIYLSRRIVFSIREAHDQRWYNLCRKLGWSLQDEFLAHQLLAPKKYKWIRKWSSFIDRFSQSTYYIPYSIRKKAQHAK